MNDSKSRITTIKCNSLKSIIIKLLIKLSNFKKNTSNIENTRKYMKWCQKRQPNKIIFQWMKKKKYNDFIYYKRRVNSNSKKKAIIYIHGGSFVDKPLHIQVKFAKKVAKKLNFDLIVPIYETIPKGNAKLYLESMITLYKHLTDKYDELYLMGDSAGGGAALSFNLYLDNLNYKLPSGIILFSPWLDLSLSNENIIEKNDIVCSIEGNKYCGQQWAGEIDIKDYRVSPIYGDVSRLKKVFISCSKNELCQPDCIKLLEKLDACCIEYNYLQFDNQFHNFELYPIKESKIVLNEICKFIMGDE